MAKTKSKNLASDKNSLENYFYNNEKRLIIKWKHYFPIYERYFAKYKNKPVTILEIGVFQGGSLQMWKNYFGKNAKIYGVDIDARCKSLEEENIKIFIGSQSDKNFLRQLKKEIPKVDIILDDGGHTMKQQKITFDELIDHVKDDGIYMCEDCHTSYWPPYGGGYRRRGTFIEYTKKLIDYLNAWHIKNTNKIKVNDFTKTVNSIHFYDSIVVFEKTPRIKPQQIQTGTRSFEDYDRAEKSLFLLCSKIIEYGLAFFKWPSFWNS